jgi:nucleoporin POM152
MSFNDSDPHFLEYSITSFETGLVSKHDISGPFKESSPVFRKARSLDSSKSTFNLMAPTPGAYKVLRILDKDNIDIRFDHSKEVYVVSCPEAKIDQHKQALEQCSGKGNVEIPISVRGLPPWTVTYRRDSHNHKRDDQELQIDAEPVDYASPWLPGWSKPAKPDYAWAKQHEMNLSVSMGLSTPGKYDFQVMRVKDGCGNVVDFKNLVAQGHSEAEIRHVHVRERPSVSMSCDPRKPIKIIKVGDNPSENIDLSISRGTAPYQIGYVYQKTDIDEPQMMKDIVVSDIKSAKIVADRPGLYTLSHIKDDFCEGEVELPRDCAVTVATHPTVDIISHPINDSCVGAIGVTVDATFTGEGPWTVCYDVYRDNVRQGGEVCPSSTKPRLNLELKPDQSGNFEYRFKSVSDKNYGNVKVDVPPVFQNIHPQPSAKFRNIRSMKTCRGSSEQLDVELSGTGPWDIEYRIIRGTEIHLTTLKNISQKSTKLTLPPFEREGMYSVVSGLKQTRSSGMCTKWNLTYVVRQNRISER